jgi:hypothetical protein
VHSLRYIHAAAVDRNGHSFEQSLSSEQISIARGNTLMLHKYDSGASLRISSRLVVGPLVTHMSPASRYIDTQHISGTSRREVAARTHTKHIPWQ